MVTSPFRHTGRSDAIRDVLETSYRNHNLLHITAGSAVPLLKNCIWLVVRGMVKLEAVTIHGDPLLLGLAGPNEPFGEPLTNVLAFEAFTLCDSDMLCLSCAEIEQSPHLAMAMMQAVVSRYHQAETMLSLLGLRRVEERIRGFLELLAQDYGQVCEQGLRLNLRLTHQELASALCTTRVTVTRVLGLLKDEGWLQMDGQRHLVISHLPKQS
ncbi:MULTISPECIES: Crp/Fnr family transcriptional regulator [unclassified Synechococcus]|uniref:Crp/Fnr family transcriptional regulator n=1 Tax=unclassified Synechococcus TaxID=2626047 RepID=UPI0008FF43D4|nr:MULTISPECIES: Crp/Fnr family transcriptional regulator [unclassified Synechococcus]APD48225.1 transcriptional regulator [Synechococcus sp. SynAce01]MCT0246697.1 Crp/Fnr family transcriptional regulator [Synechococcus sp. CS-601]TWB93915.1 CRP-like cAMP-binding protein [Synechococcus sp. Ace-Pa]